MTTLFPYPLLSWLPDESLFSFVSRCHHLWGHQAPWRTSEILFGARRAGWQHDLPNRVDEFSRRTHGSLGEADEIVRRHTLLRYYLPFQSEHEASHHVATMRSPSVAHLKFWLGLLTSRFRAHHPLKACVQCMADDRLAHGWAYWHLEHQFPGVWTCTRHRRLLRECDYKSTGVGRFQWFLPEEAELAPAPTISPESLNELMSMSVTVGHVIAHAKPGALDRVSIQTAFLCVFRDRGWLTSSGRLRLDAAAAEFVAYSALLRALPEFEALPSSDIEARSQLARMLRPMRTGTHPLRHLVLANWLFRSGDSFLEACVRAGGNVTNRPPDNDTSAQLESASDPRQAQLADLIVEGGLSARAAARELGIDTATAIVWAAKQGIATGRRPKALKDGRYEALLQALQAGIDKAEAARRHEVSIVTVTRVLRSEVGLHEQWQHARFAMARDGARKEWRDLVAACGQLGTKLLRALAPASYMWLYRHDRAWLNSQEIPVRPVGPSPSVARIRWDERDTKFRAKVEEATLALVAQGARRIGLGELCQCIPELKPKLSALDRLPLTRQAIERALAYRAELTGRLF